MKATVETTLVHSELSYKIIGCCMSVYNQLGSGHKEKVYQKALELSLKNAGLKFKEEVSCPIYYDEVQVGLGRADIIVEDTIIIELKRTSFFSPADFTQLNRYLISKKLELGIMFRFAPDRLIYRRVVNFRNPVII
ncbi:MAG TPA: GxxExxY protein [Bacteroidia bacterium]|nr:GxxExxY protein [Bacteroidia bacterium]